MKQLTKIVFLLLVALLISSCNSKKEKRNPDFLKPLQIEIPKELENNKEIIEFIRSSESAINKLSDNIEELVANGNEVLSKNTEELQTAERLKIGKMAVQFISNSTQITYVLESYQKYIESAKFNGINDAHTKSLKLIEKTMKERADNIDTKYKSYFN